MRFVPLLLALALAPQDPRESSRPWRPGVAWTWTEGEGHLSAEVWDRVEVRHQSCVRVRFRHLEHAKPWDYGDLLLFEKDGDLMLAGYRVDDIDYLAEKVPALLPRGAAVGQSWTAKFEHGSTDQIADYRWNDATFKVEGRERLVIAPGTFDTWKILFSYGREADDAFRLWIAAEAGIVRIESLNAKHSYKPWRLTLRALDLKRPDRTLPVPALEAGARAKLDDLIGELSQADAARRAEAEKAIRGLGVAAVPVLRTRAAAAADAEVRARLEAAARSISGLKVEAKALKSTISTGERLPVQFLMRNDGPDPILILPSLPGAGFQMDRKFPCFSAKVTDSDGQEPTFGIFGSFWGSPPLRGRDFRRLYPGESFDVFADPSADLPVQLGGRISDAGTYTIRLAYDISGRVEADWATEQGPPDEEALRFLALMPRGRFEAAPVTVTVIEKSK